MRKNQHCFVNINLAGFELAYSMNSELGVSQERNVMLDYDSHESVVSCFPDDGSQIKLNNLPDFHTISSSHIFTTSVEFPRRSIYSTIIFKSR
jgi:hypothetical protein